MLRRPRQGIGYLRLGAWFLRTFQGQRLLRNPIHSLHPCNRDAQYGALQHEASLQQYALKVSGSGTKEVGTDPILHFRL